MTTENCIFPTEPISLTDPRLQNCLIPPGTTIILHYQESDGSDETTTSVEQSLEREDGQMEQHEGVQAHEGEKHEIHHAAKVKHAKVKHHAEVAQADEADVVVAHEELPVLLADATPQYPMPQQLPMPTPPANTVASVGVPTTATDELSKLIPANGQIGGMTVVIAAIAVLGGGAAWKFYSQRSKEKHEEKLKEMELQASQPQNQHPSCKAENAAIHEELKKLHGAVSSLSSLHTSISEVSERVAKLESKVESPELPEGFDDLEDRLKKIEKALKPPRGKAKT